MDKRYQVFLSSTYEDLKEERLEVMKAILELDCFPVGMEYFPAANEDQWTYISDLIDQCDYYIVVLAGRYGSTDEAGIGYTQKEYEYAIEKGIPVIAFVHSSPEDLPQKKAEKTEKGKLQFEQFRQLLQTRLCKDWNNVYELGAVVSRSLSQLMKKHKRPGWVRADQVAAVDSYKEIVRLRTLVEQQENELSNLKVQAPKGSEKLAHGDEKCELEYKVTLTNKTKHYNDPLRQKRLNEVSIHSWDEIFSSFAPCLMVESREQDIKSALSKLVRSVQEKQILQNNVDDMELTSFYIPDVTLNKVILQFTALGFLNVSSIQTEKKTIRLYELSDLGKKHLIEVSAISSAAK